MKWLRVYSYVEIQFQTFIITENALHDVTQNEKNAKSRRWRDRKTFREQSKAKQRRINGIKMKAALRNEKKASVCERARVWPKIVSVALITNRCCQFIWINLQTHLHNWNVIAFAFSTTIPWQDLNLNCSIRTEFALLLLFALSFDHHPVCCYPSIR